MIDDEIVHTTHGFREHLTWYIRVSYLQFFRPFVIFFNCSTKSIETSLYRPVSKSLLPLAFRLMHSFLAPTSFPVKLLLHFDLRPT